MPRAYTRRYRQEHKEYSIAIVVKCFILVQIEEHMTHTMTMDIVFGTNLLMKQGG
jgi:hypothetical protein